MSTITVQWSFKIFDSTLHMTVSSHQNSQTSESTPVNNFDKICKCCWSRL